jgi:hypothetical protein
MNRPLIVSAALCLNAVAALAADNYLEDPATHYRSGDVLNLDFAVSDPRRMRRSTAT